MLTLTEYFRPENPIALAIVYILWGVFVIWLFYLVRGGIRIRRHGSTIQALIRANPELVAARLERQAKRSRGARIDRTPSDEFRAHLPPGVGHDEPVAIHLENIYAAGCSESRLDIGELLRHTEHVITKDDSVRLHFLSIFLIIGLLGTLFGLADSILALLQLLKQSADVGSNLAALLGSLKGAFAPSISGVLTSIIGTGVFALYNRVYVSPLIAQLREVTINFWVPELYPTTSQVAAEAAQRSQAAAAKVIASAETISEKTEALASTLKTAVEDTQSYAAAIDKLSSAIKAATEPAATALAALATQLTRFDEAMSRWAQFEKTLEALYQELTANQKMLAERSAEVGTLIGAQTERLGTMATGLADAHREVLAEVLKTLAEMSERMKSLHAPFIDAKEQMLGVAVNFQGFARSQLDIYGKTLETVEGLPAALVKAFTPIGQGLAEQIAEGTKPLADRIAQGVQALAESRQFSAEPWEAVREQLEAAFREQNRILSSLVAGMRGVGTQPYQAAYPRAAGQTPGSGAWATPFVPQEPARRGPEVPPPSSRVVFPGPPVPTPQPDQPGQEPQPPEPAGPPPSGTEPPPPSVPATPPEPAQQEWPPPAPSAPQPQAPPVQQPARPPSGSPYYSPPYQPRQPQPAPWRPAGPPAQPPPTRPWWKVW